MALADVFQRPVVQNLVRLGRIIRRRRLVYLFAFLTEYLGVAGTDAREYQPTQ